MDSANEELLRANAKLEQAVRARTVELEEELAKVRASEFKFRQLVETLPHIVWIFDNSLSSIYFNQKWADYCGRDIALGSAWREIVHPEDLKIADEVWRNCITRRIPYQGEQRLLSANGHYRWFLVRGVPVFDDGGNLTNWYGTCTDIQNEKDAVKLENEHFKLMTEAMPVATWSTDIDGKCEYVNKLWLEIVDMTLDEIVGDGWVNCLHPDDRQRAADAWRNYVERDIPYDVEFRLKSKNGYQWHLTRGKKVRDANGKVIKMVGGSTNIQVQREQAEELERLVKERTSQLSSSKNLTDLVIESMSEALIVADSEGRLSYLNSAARMLYPDQHVPATIEEISTERMKTADGLHEMDSEALPIAEALNGLAINDFEFMWGKRVVAVSARPIREPDGSISGSVATIRDITARKEAEREKEHAREEALAASQAKSRFLSMMSHEVRTPMAGVIGLIELIHLGGEDADVTSLSKLALESCKRLLHILNDLLDASKLHARAVNLEYRYFSVRPVIGDLVQLASREAEKKQLELSSSVDENVPAFVCGDELRLRQIMQNLLFNAIKFTPTGTIDIRVDFTEQTTNATILKFSVTDSGIGISDEQKQKLFEPFVQAEDSTTRVYGGTGLGLNICRTLTKLMEGEIGVVSEIGKGSTFWVRIPFRDDSCRIS